MQNTEIKNISTVADCARRVVDWQFSQYDPADNSFFREEANGEADAFSWLHGVLHIGIAEISQAMNDSEYWQKLKGVAQANEWKLGPRLMHADDHVIAQMYMELYDEYKEPHMLEPTIKQLDTVMQTPPRCKTLEFEVTEDSVEEINGKVYTDSMPCKDRWSWSDALYMATPLWMRLGELTGEQRYVDWADHEFWESHDYLFDNDIGLYYRDSRFFEKRGESGEKIFWARGSGWVFAGVMRILKFLPADHPSRSRYIEVFKKMADAIVQRQTKIGSWHVSMDSIEPTEKIESSATGLFVAGLAWGVRSGVLSDAKYTDAMAKGWDCLVQSIHPNGKLGWVQKVSNAPGEVDYEDTHVYGVGAFLQAAAELIRLGYEHS